MLKLFWLGLILALCVTSYLLGTSQCQLNFFKQQSGVENHVRRQTAAIHAKPNARRDALLELMRRGKL